MAASLFVISGPAGVGKGTLVSLLKEQVDNVWVSVSATTRPPREGEQEGVHYFFVSDERFDDLIATDGLLEWALVHRMYRYGTLRSAVEEHLAAGFDVILEIDEQGAFAVQEAYPDAVLIFIMPPSVEELLARLKGRGTETDEVIGRRMETAMVEISHADRYNEQVVNDDINEALAQLKGIIASYRDK